MSPRHRTPQHRADGPPDRGHLTSIDTAKRWMTEPIRTLLVSEVQNEQFGGVKPATLASTIDSLLQGLEVFGLTEADYVALLAIVGLVGTDTEVRDLL